jgi:hypothetical protein
MRQDTKPLFVYITDLKGHEKQVALFS